MSSDRRYMVTYNGDSVVSLGKAGKFMNGTVMYLGEDDARAAADVDRLRQRVTAEDAWACADQNHIRRAMQIEGARHAKRWLCILMDDDRAAAPLLECELEPRDPADRRGGPGIAGREAAWWRSALPTRRAYDS